MAYIIIAIVLISVIPKRVRNFLIGSFLGVFILLPIILIALASSIVKLLGYLPF